MALGDTNVIDILGVDRESRVLVLTLTDAWGWSPDEEDEHLRLLEEKLNTYVAAIESREVHAEYAKRTGVALHPAYPIKVCVRALHPLSAKGNRFFDYVREMLSAADRQFEHVVGLTGA